MVCSKCGQECAEGVKFCTNCGAEVVAAEVKEAVAEVKEEVTETVAEVKEEVKEEVAEAKEEAAETVAEVKEEVAEAVAEVKEEVAEVKEAVAEKVEDVKEAVAEPKKENPIPEEPKEAKDKKKATGPVLAVVAIFLILIGAISALNSGGKDDYITAGKKAVLNVDEVDDEVVVYFMDGKKKQLDYEEVNGGDASQDRTVVCFKNEDDELIVIRNGKVKETGIEEASYIEVSTYGDTIVYMTDVETDKKTYESFGTLNLYYTKNGKTKEIAEDVLVGSAVLSPDGETVAFVSDYDAEDDFKGYYSVKGKEPVEVGKEQQVFAIADDAKYIYYIDVDRIYAKKKKKDGEKLASDMEEVRVLFNADMSEMIYVNSDTSYLFDDDEVDSKTYISVKAGEKEKISNERVYSVVLPSDACTDYYDVYGNECEVSVYLTGVETFEEQLFSITGGVGYLNKKNEMKEVASNVRDFALAEDGESFVYANSSGDVIRVTKFNKGGEEKKIGDDVEAEEIYAAGDLDYVYYINADDELCCIKGKKDKKLVDDVTSAAISEDGTMIYFVIENEELCYVKKTGKKKEIRTEDEGGIDVGNALGMVAVDISNEDIEGAYYMDGKKLKTLFEEEK